MSRKSDYILPLGILAAIAIIIYVIYNKLKDNPITQAVDAVSKTTETIIKEVDKPLIPSPPDVVPDVHSPSITNVLFPPSGLPGFIDFATKNMYTGTTDVMAVRNDMIVSVAQIAQDIGLLPKEKSQTAIKPTIRTVSPNDTYYSPVIAGEIATNVLFATKTGQEPSRASETSLHGKKSSSGFTIGGR
jgi:hypothetical protein